MIAETYTTERLAVWQQRLNLQDWSISVVVARATELKPKTLGNIHWDLPKKTAVIRVLDPADYKLPYREMLQDMEFTVVHELIHLEWRQSWRIAAQRCEPAGRGALGQPHGRSVAQAGPPQIGLSYNSEFPQK